MLAPWPRLRPRSRAPRVTPAETYRPGVARAPPARRRARGARTIIIIAKEYSRPRRARRARPTDGRASRSRARARSRDRPPDPCAERAETIVGRPRPLYKTLCSARTTLRIVVGAPCRARSRPCRLRFWRPPPSTTNKTTQVLNRPTCCFGKFDEFLARRPVARRTPRDGMPSPYESDSPRFGRPSKCGVRARARPRGGASAA